MKPLDQLKLDDATKTAGANLLEWLMLLREHDRQPFSICKDPPDPKPFVAQLNREQLRLLWRAVDHPEVASALLPIRQVVATHVACCEGFLRDWKYMGMDGEAGFKVEVFLREPGDKKPDSKPCTPEPVVTPEPEANPYPGSPRVLLRKPEKVDGEWEF